MNRFERFQNVAPREANALIRKFCQDADTYPDIDYRLRIPLLLLSADERIFIQQYKPKHARDSGEKRLTIPALYWKRDEILTPSFKYLVSHKLRSEVLMVPSTQEIDSHAIGYREFDSEQNTRVLAVTGLSKIQMPADAIQPRLSYATRIGGELSWMPMNDAREAIYEQAERLPTSNLPQEAKLVFDACLS